MLKVNPEWRANHDEIDEEHVRFFALASRLLGVVRTDPAPELLREAVDTFRKRLALHTATEEQYAARIDPDAARILKEDHDEMLAALKRLSNGVGKLAKAQLREEVERIVAMIAKHEREVDVPIFRMIGQRR